MVVQHNLTAMNSNRMLGVTTGTQAKSTEKLSSGYKINRAADDAAGLAISEKMRKQIRGLTQASTNAQDGISAVQTAEGALAEVHDMLQRMNELAVKSANGTNSADDRSYIQSEIDQLVTEIDRVSSTTKFNETYLLKGDGALDAKSDAAATIKTAVYKADGTEMTDADIVENLAAETPVKMYSEAPNDTKVDEVKGTVTLATTGWATGDSITVAGATVSYDGGQTDVDKMVEELNKNAGFSANYVASADGDNLVVTQKTGKDATAADMKALVTAATVGGNSDAKDSAAGVAGVTEKPVSEGVLAVRGKDYTYTPEVAADLTLSLHVGADSTDDNKISLTIASMNSASLGVSGLDVSTETAATASIDTISDALKMVSKQRSDLGAIQNRLEHTIKNLDNVVENTTSAESAIRDTDMASEMVKFSNNNILAQAGTSMLAQANQSNQNILSLLG